MKHQTILSGGARASSASMDCALEIQTEMLRQHSRMQLLEVSETRVRPVFLKMFRSVNKVTMLSKSCKRRSRLSVLLTVAASLLGTVDLIECYARCKREYALHLYNQVCEYCIWYTDDWFSYQYTRRAKKVIP